MAFPGFVSFFEISLKKEGEKIPKYFHLLIWMLVFDELQALFVIWTNPAKKSSKWSSHYLPDMMLLLESRIFITQRIISLLIMFSSSHRRFFIIKQATISLGEGKRGHYFPFNIILFTCYHFHQVGIPKGTIGREDKVGFLFYGIVKSHMLCVR
jgi:hypothetical protein